MEFATENSDCQLGMQIVAFYSYKGGVGRTMALCNVAAALASSARSMPRPKPVLCIDLDLEAPSVGVFLPPAISELTQGEPTQEIPAEDGTTEVEPVQGAGFLRLARDFVSEVTSVPMLDTGKWLRKALSPGSEYLHRAGPNLYVLPAGFDLANEGDFRGTVDELSRNAITTSKLERAAEKCRELLKSMYAYTLIDCRSGLPDLEFGISDALSDVLVTMFRTQANHIVGINVALAAFLRNKRRSLRIENFDVPVIPVLSPRPTYTDKRVKLTKRAAKSEIFKWLDARADPNRPEQPVYKEFIELVFDKSVEIDEHLLMPLSPELGEEDIDDEAPLYLGYKKLAETIQKGNFTNDLEGAGLREADAFRDGDIEGALGFHLRRLRMDPQNPEFWEILVHRYVDLFKRDTGVTHRIRRFCENFRKLDGAIPYVFSRLWLARFTCEESPRAQMDLMAQAWSMASKDQELRRRVLTEINQFLAENSKLEMLRGLPTRDSAVREHARNTLSSEWISKDEIFNQIVLLESYFWWRPQDESLLEKTLNDELALADDVDLKSRILFDLGNFYRHCTKFEDARAAFLSSRKIGISGSDPLPRLARLLPEKEWVTLVDKSELAPTMRARLLVGEQRRQHLLKHKSGVDGDQVKITLVLDAIRDDDLDEAIRICAEEVWDDSDERNPLLDLGWWLRGAAGSISQGLKVEALDRWERDGSWAITSFSFLAAWAAHTEEVAAFAANKLQEALWPIDRCWYLFFASSAQDGSKHQRAFFQELERCPWLGFWMRSADFFFLFQVVSKERIKRGVMSADDGFLSVLEEIERRAANVELPSGSTRALELKVSEEPSKIVSRWRGWASKSPARQSGSRRAK